jgi:adenylosuccinate synthase
MKNYWEKDPDDEINIGKNILRYWREVGKLQIASTYIDKNDGVEKIKRCVALDLDSLRECPEAMELMQKVFADITV